MPGRVADGGYRPRAALGVAATENYQSEAVT